MTRYISLVQWSYALKKEGPLSFFLVHVSGTCSAFLEGCKIAPLIPSFHESVPYINYDLPSVMVYLQTLLVTFPNLRLDSADGSCFFLLTNIGFASYDTCQHLTLCPGWQSNGHYPPFQTVSYEPIKCWKLYQMYNILWNLNI